MSIYATNECISGLMDQLSELTKKRDALKAEIERLRADAALGRAVRKMPDMAKLWHAEVRWYLHPGDGPCLPLGTGNTPEAALAAAGLMEEEGEVT